MIKRKCQFSLLWVNDELIRTEIKGFVVPTKLFVKIGITKIFFATTKCLDLSTKRLVAAANFWLQQKKCPYFYCRNKTIFSVRSNSAGRQSLPRANSFHCNRVFRVRVLSNYGCLNLSVNPFDY